MNDRDALEAWLIEHRIKGMSLRQLQNVEWFIDWKPRHLVLASLTRAEEVAAWERAQKEAKNEPVVV